MKRTMVFLLAAMAFAVAGTPAFAQASVTTDQSDYPPGSTVQISGSGFQPGETVQLQVVNLTNPSDTGAEHDPWQVTADASGNFQTTWFVTSDEAGATLQLSATGLSSSLTAQTTFTDAVTITAASGGSSISADTAANAASPSWTTLGAITIAEGANGDFKTANNQTMTLKVPAGFQFNTTQVPNVSYTPGRNITAASAAFSDSTTLVITFSVGNNNALDSMTIGGSTAIQVRPTVGTPLATGKHIYCSAQSQTTTGITTSTDGSSGSNFGGLTEVAGAIAHYSVSASLSQNAGVAFTVTVTAQDQFNNTVTTDNSTVVTMTSSTGNVQYDSNDDGVYGDNTQTLTSGTFTITSKDNTAETVNLIATDANSKSGTLSSVVVSANPPANSYRSAATGNWGTLGTWQRWNGSTWATPTAGEGVPTSSSGSITIRSPNVVTVAAAASADQLVVDAGATLTINNTLTLANGAGTDLDIFGTVNGTAVDTISPANTTVVVESGGSLDTSSTGADLTVSGNLTVAGGTVTTPNKKGIAGAGTLSISGGTVTVGQGPNDDGGEDLKMTGTITMSGGTLIIWHDFRPNPANFSATGGTVEFAGTGGGGAFGTAGTYHFFNVIVDAGVNPQFNQNNANVIAIAGSLTLNGGVAVPFPTGNGSTVGSLWFGTVQQVAGAWAGSGAAHNNATYLSGTGQINGTAGLASELVFTTVAYTGGSALTAGTTSGTMTVQLQDSSGNPVVVGSGTVTVNLSSDSTGTYSFRDDATGNTTITSVTIATGSSSASFKYNDQKAGTPTLTAAGSGLTSGTQQETVNAAAAASRLAFTTQPVNTTNGATMANVVVQIQDQFSNNVANSGTNISLALNGGGTLSGTTNQTTDATGKATFSNLSIAGAGSGKTFTASASLLTSATSSSFNVAQAVTSTTVTSPVANPSVHGQSGVTFHAVVSATSPGSGTPGGTVQFKTNSVNFGSAVSLSGGAADSGALPTTLPPGSYTVTADYSGDSDFNTSSGTLSGGQTITAASTSIAVSSSENPSGYQDSVIFTATLPSDATGSVIFKTNSVLFDTETLSDGSTTTTNSTLPRGTNTITAEYAGDGNYTGSTNDLAGGQVVTNHPPVANAAIYSRAKGTSIKINVTNLLAQFTSDADGDAVRLASFGSSTNGSTLMLATNVTTSVVYIVLTPANNLSESFNYTVSDGNGGTNGALITVNVTNAVGQVTGSISTTGGGAVTTTWAGIPGSSYVVQRSPDLSTWTDLWTTNAPTAGVFIFTDPAPPQPTAYYRLRQN